MSDHPAPMAGDTVNYREFLSIMIEAFEERFLIGNPPDMGSLREADTLRTELNEQLIETASIVHRLGSGIERDDVKEEDIEALRSSIKKIEEISDEIEDKHY